MTFGRNREELAWLLFVLLVGGAFAVTGALVYLARLTAEAAVGRFDIAFDLIWGLACLGLLGTVGYYAVVVSRFVRHRVTVDESGVAVGPARIAWAELSAVREERIKKRFYTFHRLELVRDDGSLIAVTSAQVADFKGLVDRVLKARSDIAPEVVHR